MSYLEKYGITEEEYRATMEEAHDHFQACNEQQAQCAGCQNLGEPMEDDPNEGDDDADTRDYDDERDPMFNRYDDRDFGGLEDQHLDSYMEDRMSGGYDF